MTVLNKKRTEELRRDGRIYVVRMLPFLSVITAGGGIVFSGMAAGSVFILEGGRLAAALSVFMGFALLGLAGYFCCLFWVIGVNEETGILLCHRPPLRPMMIRISEITRVQILEDRLTGPQQYRIRVYRGEKKLFEITDMMSEYGRLRKYLEETTMADDRFRFYEYDPGVMGSHKIEKGFLRPGKAEIAERKEEFIVAETVAEKVRSGTVTLFLTVIIIPCIIGWKENIREDSRFLFFFSVAVIMAVMSLSEFIRNMLFRISVSSHEIRVREGIRREIVYTMREITRVETKGNFIVLYAGEKRVTKVSKECENAAALTCIFPRDDL